MKMVNLKIIQLNYIYLYKKLIDKKFDIELEDINLQTMETIYREYIEKKVGFPLIDKNLNFSSKIEELINKSELDILSSFSNEINSKVNILKNFKIELNGILHNLDSRLFITKIKKIKSQMGSIKSTVEYIENSISLTEDNSCSDNKEILDFLFN